MPRVILMCRCASRGVAALRFAATFLRPFTDKPPRPTVASIRLAPMVMSPTALRFSRAAEI